MSFSGIWRDRSAPTGIAYYLLGRVLTYKTLIYLLNLQMWILAVLVEVCTHEGFLLWVGYFVLSSKGVSQCEISHSHSTTVSSLQ